jgi:hypothetical protein
VRGVGVAQEVRRDGFPDPGALRGARTMRHVCDGLSAPLRPAKTCPLAGVPARNARTAVAVAAGPMLPK